MYDIYMLPMRFSAVRGGSIAYILDGLGNKTTGECIVSLFSLFNIIHCVLIHDISKYPGHSQIVVSIQPSQFVGECV